MTHFEMDADPIKSDSPAGVKTGRLDGYFEIGAVERPARAISEDFH
ncbi:hypothetical protein ACFVRD_29075 [Streptomyces sp. NPDC057908]